MTAPDNTTLQANFKLPNGDLINVYGKDAFAFKGNLEALADLAQQVLDTGNLLRGAQTVVDAGLTGTAPAPLSLPAQQAQAVQQYQQSAAQAAPQAAPQQAAPASGPVCKHGPMTFRSGISKKSGKPYTAHFCPSPQGTPDQCDPIFGN